MDLRKVMKEAVSEFERRKKACKQCQAPPGSSEPYQDNMHTCIEKAKKKKKPEDLTKLTDEVLNIRIIHSYDMRAGEPTHPLVDELWRRYVALQRVHKFVTDNIGP